MTSERQQSDPLDAGLFAELGQRDVAPRGELLDAIHREMAEESSTQTRRLLQPLSRKARVILSAACLFIGLVMTSLGALKADARSLLVGGALASIALAGVFLAVAAPGGPKRAGLAMRRGMITAFVALSLIALGMLADHFGPLPHFFSGGELAHALSCGVHTLVSGIVCSAGLMVLWWRTDPFTPGTTGALLGTMGGLLGLLGVGIACPSAEGWHLVFGHGLAVVALAALGWRFGKRWLTP